MVKFLMAAVSSIYVFLQVLYIVANAADMATCVGEKGEKVRQQLCKCYSGSACDSRQGLRKRYTSVKKRIF